MRLDPRLLVLSSALAALSGCAEGGTKGAPSATAAATAAPTAVVTAATTASAAAPAAPLPPRSDCPKDSVGAGTLEQPCAGKGAARMMEAKWTGTTDDEKGPSFAVTNRSPAPILYGKIVVYFYDKAGKQLEVKPPGASTGKPYLVCSGANLFSGVMKVKEKATLTFSCVKKSHIPEGTAAIEGEMLTVGFADASEKKSEFFWTNADLAPDARPKGGAVK